MCMCIDVTTPSHVPSQAFCSAVLGLLQEEGKWSPKILSLALNALRIFAREHHGVEGLISREGLLVIAQLAGLSARDPEEDIPADRLEGGLLTA